MALAMTQRAAKTIATTTTMTMIRCQKGSCCMRSFRLISVPDPVALIDPGVAPLWWTVDR